MEKLRECPMCQCEAELYHSGRYTIGHGESGDYVGVKCTKCGIKVEFSGYANYKVDERKIKAVGRWNGRGGV